MDYEISYDVLNFGCFHRKVIHTLIEALSWWISGFFSWGLAVYNNPAIAVPVSLVGTFIFMQFFDISLNLITLFALVLAIESSMMLL
jgi:HAE1 family hydrophobic/amphiphilic exporter-1